MIPGVVNSQITYVPSWKEIHGPTNLTVNQTFAVPDGAEIRVTYNTPLDGQTLTTATTAASYWGAQFEEWDYIDEGTWVYVFGAVNITRNSSTQLTVVSLTDYGDPYGAWIPSFISMEAYY